jgi:ADP-heptose:LPS heptosyltransferase
MSPPPRIKILVIRRRYLGDIVLLGPLLRNLRLHWPDAPIAVLVEPAYAPVLELNPDVTATLAAPSGATAWPGFIRALRAERFTHVFNLDNTEKTALITRLSGAAFRLALHHGGYRVKLPAAYTHLVNDPNERHESRPITDYYLCALAAAGVPVVTHEVRLVPRSEDVADLRRYVGAGGPVLLVHPGSRSPWRIWPAERFAAICDRAQDELGAQVILTGGPAEAPLLADIRRRAQTHLIALEPPTLPRFAALARLSSALLCHDSGPMHIAAAVGTPVIALYGSQNTRLFRPPGEGHVVLAPSLPCGASCVAPGRCIAGDSYHNACVQRLTVESVWAAVASRISRPAEARR